MSFNLTDEQQQEIHRFLTSYFGKEGAWVLSWAPTRSGPEGETFRVMTNVINRKDLKFLMSHIVKTVANGDKESIELRRDN